MWLHSSSREATKRRNSGSLPLRLPLLEFSFRQFLSPPFLPFAASEYTQIFPFNSKYNPLIIKIKRAFVDLSLRDMTLVSVFSSPRGLHLEPVEGERVLLSSSSRRFTLSFTKMNDYDFARKMQMLSQRQLSAPSASAKTVEPDSRELLTPRAPLPHPSTPQQIRV